MMESSFAPGHEFAGRYRLTQLIGVGHSAEVYLAEDLTLQRRVVVKVLRAHLAQHEEIRRTFRDRIVQSAALRHPHVARVLDGGQQAGAIFMVTEYLGGGSLEDLLRAGVVLGVEETARLGRDVAGALAYVHEHALLHGELAPTKILFDEAGYVRISDVALAGLAGPHRHYSTRDDVRYFSPEQARGDVVSAASDVYALGLILFETATGATPFEGATAEATLRERLHGPLPTRPELGGLDIVLALATVPDALTRLTAEEMARRLSGVVPDEDPFIKYDEPAPSLLGSFAIAEPRQSVGFRAPSPHQIVASPRVSATFGATPGARPPSPPRRSTPGAFEDLSPVSARRRPVYLAAAVLIVVLAVGGGFAWKLGYLSSKHTAPSVYGLSLAEASTLVKSDGLTLNVTAHVPSNTVAAGDVVTQTPAAGSSVAGGSSITVTVSSGPPSVPVTIPTSLLGTTCAAATATLAALHVTATCPATAAIASTSVASGRVAGWLSGTTKNPTAVARGSHLVLELSTGAAAVATTTAPTTTAPTSTAPTTAPTTTAPTTAPTTTAPTTAPTTTAPTTTTTARTLPMPNLAGMTRAEAIAALTKAGLFYTTQGPGAHTTRWTHVVSTLPAAGTTVPYLSTVTLNVAE